MNRQIEASLELNKEEMIVIELEPKVVDDKQGMFYSADAIDENCLSSKKFKEFSPIQDKDQLVICSQTRGVGQKLVPSYRFLNFQ